MAFSNAFVIASTVARITLPCHLRDSRHRSCIEQRGDRVMSKAKSLLFGKFERR